MGAMATPPKGRARRMVTLAAVLLPSLAFIGLLVVGITHSSRSTAAPGKGAPSFSAPRLDGKGAVSLASLEGKPVVLNFWASWCAPCKAEAPLLATAAGRYAGKVTFVGMDVHDARSDAVRFVTQHHLDYLQLRDEGGDVASAYGLTGQPETFFIDKNGAVVQHVLGALTPGVLSDALGGLAS